MAWSQNLKLLRQLVSEIRHNIPEKSRRDNLTIQYVFKQFRKYQTTDEQLCKARKEMQFMGTTYFCYLRSGRKYQAINQKFLGKGDRSIEETANLVGFKLPHDPK